MRFIVLLCAASLLLSSCSKKTEPAGGGSPADPVLALAKGINAQDSVAITNTLSATAKEEQLSSIRKEGGFKATFDSTKGLTVEMKILGIQMDSSTPHVAKVYVNERFTHDTSHFQFDSAYFNVSKEENGWKVNHLSPRMK